jgi:hypothetical protein
MESLLTGLGLSGSAGLNAYLPLFILGVAQRMGWMDLAEPYDTLGAPAVLGALIVLMIIEMTADKVPAVDSLNDGINTVIRPAAGALLMASSTSAVNSSDPEFITFMSILSGGISAGVIHALKAVTRPAVTVTTGGFGNMFVSLIEDVFAFFVSVFAIFLPFIVIFFSMSAVALTGWAVWDMQRTKHYFGKSAMRLRVRP